MLFTAAMLSALALLMLLAYLNGRILALERRIKRLERFDSRPPPHPYRVPPECEECPASSPAACQACHEEEEAYVRRGV